MDELPASRDGGGLADHVVHKPLLNLAATATGLRRHSGTLAQPRVSIPVPPSTGVNVRVQPAAKEGYDSWQGESCSCGECC